MASVRIFAYTGMRQILQLQPKQFTGDTVFVLEEPYIWNEILVLNGATPVTHPTHAGDGSTILRVEVPDGTQIRYEVNPNGPNASNARLAGNGSPGLSGSDQFAWGPGYSLSIVDKASFP